MRVRSKGMTALMRPPCRRRARSDDHRPPSARRDRHHARRRSKSSPGHDRGQASLRHEQEELKRQGGGSRCGPRLMQLADGVSRGQRQARSSKRCRARPSQMERIGAGPCVHREIASLAVGRGCRPPSPGSYERVQAVAAAHRRSWPDPSRHRAGRSRKSTRIGRRGGGGDGGAKRSHAQVLTRRRDGIGCRDLADQRHCSQTNLLALK